MITESNSKSLDPYDQREASPAVHLLWGYGAYPLYVRFNCVVGVCCGWFAAWRRIAPAVWAWCSWCDSRVVLLSSGSVVFLLRFVVVVVAVVGASVRGGAGVFGAGSCVELCWWRWLFVVACSAVGGGCPGLGGGRWWRGRVCLAWRGAVAS